MSQFFKYDIHKLPVRYTNYNIYSVRVILVIFFPPKKVLHILI